MSNRAWVSRTSPPALASAPRPSASVLGAVSPRLMQAYRDGDLTLDQLIAFCITEDHTRQEAVYDRLSSWQREPYHIRRLLTETHVAATDRRAKFIGADAYLNAGGHVERDLFTEDGGGFFADAGLLDRLVLEQLTAIAAETQAAEGWKWSEAHIDFPHGHGLRRVYQKAVPLSEADQVAEEATQTEFDQLTAEYEGWEELPDDIDKRFGELEAELERFGCLKAAFDPEDIQRGGIIVSLTHDGSAKIERGLVRLEDLAPEPERTAQSVSEGGEGDAGYDDQGEGTPSPEGDDEPERPLSDALIRDLTTHRTLALRLVLGEQPELAARALAHRLALDIFYRRLDIGGLEVKATSSFIAGFAEGLDETPTATALQTRHDAWAAQLPPDAADLWAYLMALEAETLGALMAHCVAQTVNVVKQPYGNVNLAKAGDQLAASLHLDMAEHWRPTVRSYFGRVTKSHIVEAVREAVGAEAADRPLHPEKAGHGGGSRTIGGRNRMASGPAQGRPRHSPKSRTCRTRRMRTQWAATPPKTNRFRTRPSRGKGDGGEPSPFDISVAMVPRFGAGLFCERVAHHAPERALLFRHGAGSADLVWPCNLSAEWGEDVGHLPETGWQERRGIGGTCWLHPSAGMALRSFESGLAPGGRMTPVAAGFRSAFGGNRLASTARKGRPAQQSRRPFCPSRTGAWRHAFSRIRKAPKATSTIGV